MPKAPGRPEPGNWSGGAAIERLAAAPERGCQRSGRGSGMQGKSGTLWSAVAMEKAIGWQIGKIIRLGICEVLSIIYIMSVYLSRKRQRSHSGVHRL